ncbi:fibropellin-1-like isoform X2 [Argopecten irradians]
MFTIFVGSDVDIKVVAKPTNPTSNVSTFFFTRNDGVLPMTSAVTDESSVDPRAKGQAVLWTPVSSDIGDHILCARVQDSAGFDSLPRCVIIRVKDAPVGVSSTTVHGKPAFLHWPSNGEIACLVGSNCRFPIYAFSSTAGGITGISLTSSTAAGCHISSLKDGSTIQSGAKMVDISFQDTSIGSKKICLTASDVNAVIMKCFEAIVRPKDPCEIQPCKNGAECVTNGDKTSFVCMCRAGYAGTTCDIAPDKCDPNPCKFGGTCRSLGLHFECVCTSGYVGIYCDNVLDTCRPDPCGSHGVCEDVTGGYTCHCQDGYSGNDCAVHSSSPVDPCTANPSAAGCSCSALCVAPNGICVGTKGSKTCLCSKGFSGSDCQSPTSYGPPNPKFVPPTPEGGDLIKCERNTYMRSPCILSVYTSPDLGMSSAPLVKTVLPPGKVTISISSPADPQIAGIPNIYRFDVKITAQSNADPKLHICLQVAKSTDQTHATDTNCFNVEYEFKHGVDPWGTHIQTNNKFVDPTLPDQSEIVCEVGKPCHFFVYASKENGSCRHVLTSDIVTTTVFDPTDLGTSCMTDVVYDFQSSAVAGTIKKLCVKSGDTGDVRCFNMRSVAAIVDYCSSNPCQNGGVCGSSQGTFVCTCTDGYTGLSCEKGPCRPTTTPHCNNGGYCYSIGTTKTCFCKLGFLGPTCTDKSQDTVVNAKINGSKFKDGTLPKEAKCYVGYPCEIPTTLIGDTCTSPMVTPGYVSGELDVQKTMITKDPASPSDYHASVEVVSKTSGHHQICIQSINTAGQIADEVCVIVNAVNGHVYLPSKSRAYFVDPTLPDGSSVECETSKPCHLTLWVHNYDSEDSCPSVKSSDEASTGVYIHQATGTSVTGPCKVDVVFHDDQPKIYTNICFTATSTKQDVFGGDGEVRCYDVNIVNTLSVVGSCASTLCQKGGFCDGHQATSNCVCLSGYSGLLCSITHGESLTDPAPIPGVTTQTTFGDFAVPKLIRCTENEECEVSFTFTRPGGDTTTLPSIHLGHVDSDLTVRPPTVSTDPHTPEGTYHGKVKVVGSRPGNKKVCVHTPTNSPNVVGDEICFDVDVSSHGTNSAPHNTNQPHFIEPTVPPDSTLQCSPGKTCHVIMHMSPGLNHECPSLVQTQGPSDDLHMFHSDSSHVIGSCAVDVALTPPASKQGTDTLCFKTSLPYIPGESRCFNVDYFPIVSGPCHGVTCYHGGVCGVNGLCVCPIDHSGPNCGDI